MAILNSNFSSLKKIKLSWSTVADHLESISLTNQLVLRNSSSKQFVLSKVTIDNQELDQVERYNWLGSHYCGSRTMDIHLFNEAVPHLKIQYFMLR